MVIFFFFFNFSFGRLVPQTSRSLLGTPRVPGVSTPFQGLEDHSYPLYYITLEKSIASSYNN